MGLIIYLRYASYIFKSLILLVYGMHIHVHVLMRDEKEEKIRKQGQTNKAKQHSTLTAVTFPCTYTRTYLLLRVQEPTTSGICTNFQICYNYSGS